MTWPKLASMFQRRPHHRETLRPHQLGEVVRNAGRPVPGEAIGRAEDPEFLVSGEGEESMGLELSLFDEVHGNAMVGDLEHTPFLRGKADQRGGIRVG